MCGLVGCLAPSADAPLPHGWLEAASAVLAARGPDDAGSVRDGELTLGFRRLAVVDPTTAGAQPMCSRDGRYRLVYNGEIYNVPELTDELEAAGVRLHGSSDSEVLLEAFARFGPAVVRRLRGCSPSPSGTARSASCSPPGIPSASSRSSTGPATAGSPSPRRRRRSCRTGGRSTSTSRPCDGSSPVSSCPVPRRPLRTSGPPAGVLAARPPRRRPGRRALHAAAVVPAGEGGPPRSRPSTGDVVDALRGSVTAHLRSDVPLGVSCPVGSTPP